MIVISSNVPCHLSNAIVKSKEQSKEDYILERKQYFKDKIQNRSSIYDGLPIYLAKSNDTGDACFNKFAIGGENFHKTNKIDLRRLERFDWIFEIIDKIEICKKCGWIKISKDNNFDDRTDIECIVKNFKIVIVIVSKKDHYEIISAHYKRYTKTKKRTL